jgi:hypothetical protein
VELAETKQELEKGMRQMEAKNKGLREELDSEKELLEKARSGLDAARQLNLQIEEKSRVISALKNQGRHPPFLSNILFP